MKSALGTASGVVLVAGLGVPRLAASQSSEEPVRVEYQGPSTCPSEGAFFDAVLARTPRARRASDAAPARTFVVHLTSSNDESTGHLLIRAVDGTSTEREVTGDTCDEVVSALALITALAVDPAATTRPIPLAKPVPPPAPSTPAAAPPTSDTPAAPVPSDERRWHLAISVDASVAAGASPRALVGPSAMIQVIPPLTMGLAPSIHLGFDLASTGDIDLNGPTVNFHSTLGVVEACPHRWTLGSFDVEPCARVEAGALSARGSNVVPPRSNTHAWIAAGAVARAQWHFFRSLFLDFDAGMRVPFYQTTFFFEPNDTIYETSALGGWVGAGIGARFL
jgi:hypothetical protein